MSDTFKILVCAATVAVVLPAHAQMDQAQMAAAREKAQICVACHGPDGNSQNPDYPILAGQTWRYIYIELKDFKAKRRTNDAGNMTSVAATLSEQDIENLSQYIGNLN